MKSAFIIHGAFGSPDENWFPWLKSELEELDYEVIVPKFPTPGGQSLENWLDVFEDHKGRVTEETVFIAHSIGPAFVLTLLERLEVNVTAAYLIAPFVQLLDNDEVDAINSSFVERSFNWGAIRSHCKRFFVYASDNDPYVPISASKEVAEHVEGDFILVEGAGHFNADAGYTKFEQLLGAIAK